MLPIEISGFGRLITVLSLWPCVGEMARRMNSPRFESLLRIVPVAPPPSDGPGQLACTTTCGAGARPGPSFGAVESHAQSPPGPPIGPPGPPLGPIAGVTDTRGGSLERTGGVPVFCAEALEVVATEEQVPETEDDSIEIAESDGEGRGGCGSSASAISTSFSSSSITCMCESSERAFLATRPYLDITQYSIWIFSTFSHMEFLVHEFTYFRFKFSYNQLYANTF